MSDYKPLLPAPLMAAAHIAPYDKIIRNYIGSDNDMFGGGDADGVVYWRYVSVLNFDTCPAPVLPYLARMFGVDGYKGFDYAPTEALKRQTLKNALLMKRRHGTPWAIKTALENAGFQNVDIQDHLGKRFFNSAMKWDSSHLWDTNHWAHFKIEMEPPVGVLADDVDVERLMLLINYWKRCCTLCVKVTIAQLVITDFGIGDDTIFTWNSSERFDSSRKFGTL